MHLCRVQVAPKEAERFRHSTLSSRRLLRAQQTLDVGTIELPCHTTPQARTSSTRKDAAISRNQQKQQPESSKIDQHNSTEHTPTTGEQMPPDTNRLQRRQANAKRDQQKPTETNISSEDKQPSTGFPQEQLVELTCDRPDVSLRYPKEIVMFIKNRDVQKL